MSRFVRRLFLLLPLVVLALGCQPREVRLAQGAPGALSPSARAPSVASPLAGVEQVVLVVSEGWDDNQARLRRFERSGSGRFHPVGDEVPVTLGKDGMGWGRGLHGVALGAGPVKVEGDLRSPAGVFALPTAFTSHPEDLWKKPKIPVLRVTTKTLCVDSIDSKSYNRIVDADRTRPRDWHNPERMLRPDGLYRFGLVVDHNVPETKPGAGSCIFMHLWRRPGAPTVGCTAMDPTAMQVLIAWLDAGRRPVLVQLPRLELDRLAPAWGAPELAAPAQRDDE